MKPFPPSFLSLSPWLTHSHTHIHAHTMHATNWVYRQPLLCCFAFANWYNGLGITLRGFRSRSSSGSPRTHAVLIHSSSVVVPLRPLMSMYFTQLRQGADCSTPLWATTHRARTRSRVFTADCLSGERWAVHHCVHCTATSYLCFNIQYVFTHVAITLTSFKY